MEMKLSENIRNFRRERSLTQEQLAEVLGVTAGAVYKWEAKLSVPDLDLIVQMADFFDTSVDVLLGYTMQDHRLDATVRRLQEYRRNKDRTGLIEAEKALKKYPHSFRILNECATMFRAFGIEYGDKALFRRALALHEQSLPLLSQNTDPEISEQTICAKIAESYLGLGEMEKGIELLKKHNAGGMYSAKIGNILSMQERSEEAAPYLSESMARIVSLLCETISGYTNVCLQRGDPASAEAILSWGITTFAGLRKENKPNLLDKVGAIFLAVRAGMQFLEGKTDAARESLVKAKAQAAFFDAAPSYDESDIRFIDRIEGASAHDDIGATAAEAIHHAVLELENEAFTALWNRIREEEE